MKLRPILPLIFLCITACHTSRKTTITPAGIPLDTISISANNNPLNIYRESAPKTWDILYTRVALKFSFEEKTAEGRAWLDVTPYCCNQDSLVLDAKTMQIDTVLWDDDRHLRVVPFAYANNQLIIYHKGTAPVWAGDRKEKYVTSQVYIHYKAMPYADTSGGGSAAISEARGLYFINTDRKIAGKPVEIWTQGETESNSHWMPTIDKPNERFTTQIELTIPDSMQTLSNGALMSSTKAGNGMRTDIWAMDKELQAYAVMFAIGRYEVIKDKWRDKEVAYYVEPEYAPYARLMFRHTPEMMEYFSSITGVPFPWHKYSQIVARDYVSGAMENTTASLFGEFMNQNTREIEDNNFEDVVSHELFHQWFGDYVTMESWSNLTLSESFANYSEQLWRRHYYGDAAADELAWEDLKKYLISTEKGNDPQLVRYYYNDREDMFDRISYNKGGATLNYLHGLMGDTLFYRAMNIYLTSHALQSAEVSQWRMAIEQATGLDWSWFFNQWYYSSGHPVLDIKYAYDDAAGQLKVTVHQQSSPDSAKLYRLPLKTAIVYNNELQEEDWLIKSRTQTFTYPYRNGVRPVIVPDYEHWLPGLVDEHKEPAQWLAQYKGVKDYINKRRAIASVFTELKQEDATKLFNLALNDPMPEIRAYTLQVLLATENEQQVFTRQVQFLASQDAHRRVRAAAFNVLTNWKISDARHDIETATGDSSYLVAGAALRGLTVLDEKAGYGRAKSLLTTKPRAELEEAIWEAISEHGAAADFYIFAQKADEVYGLRRINLAGYLASYITRIDDDTTFQKSLELLDHLYQSEMIANYKQAIFAAALTSGEEFGEIYGKANAAQKALLRKRAEETKTAIRPWIRNMKEQPLQEDLLNKAFKF